MDNGSATFDITNQTVVSGDDSQGDDNDDNELGDGDDQGTSGQLSVFQWHTTFVNFLQTAQGFGILFVPSNPLMPARWGIFGKGNHPAYGNFAILAKGNLMCVLGQGQGPGSGTFRLFFADGSTDSGTIPSLFRGSP
jgi:hypothetical protein